MNPIKIEPYQTHFALAQKYAREENFELAYFSMLEATSALLEYSQGFMQSQLTVLDELAEKAKPIDHVI